MDKKNNRLCVLCNKKIKEFAKWNDDVVRPIHRSCWLNFRACGNRYADFLFCGDRPQIKNKNVIIEPKKD